MSAIAYWQILAGLGLFLFGMKQIELALGSLLGRAFKLSLRNRTHNPWQGAFIGASATALLQSSSLVGLIMLAFVGTGALELRNALGIILGANLGTTFSGWLVVVFGFKLNLTAAALPLLAVGTLTTLVIKPRGKMYSLALLLLGVGFLLLGLSYMKASMQEM